MVEPDVGSDLAGMLPTHDVGRLLEGIGAGSRATLHTLVPLVYEELRVLAQRQRRRWSLAQAWLYRDLAGCRGQPS